MFRHTAISSAVKKNWLLLAAVYTVITIADIASSYWTSGWVSNGFVAMERNLFR